MKLAIGSLATALTLIAAPTSALTINLSLNLTATPTFDSDGSKLTDIMEAAADYWIDIIEDTHTIDIEYGYQDLANDVGKAVVMPANINAQGRATFAQIAFDTNTSPATERLWYFDADPTTHTEFNMQQVLYRDLELATQTLYYKGSPPDLLETGFGGDAKSSATFAAKNGGDMFSAAVHEIAHALGTLNVISSNQTSMDDDYDFNPATIDGATAAAKVYDTISDPKEPEHLRCADCLLFPTYPIGARKLPSATDIFAVAQGPDTPWAQIDLPRKDALDPGSWNFALNWEGARVPDLQDTVYVRFGGTINVTALSFAGDLTVDEDSTLNINAAALIVLNTVNVQNITGPGPATINIAPGTVLGTNTININDNGLIQLDNADIDAQKLHIDPGGTLAGDGEVTLTSTDPLNNNGLIQPGSPGLTIDANEPIDLDGSSESGLVDATGGDININAELADPFSSTLTLGFGRDATFSHSTAFNGATINMTGNIFGAAATITAPFLNINNTTINAALSANINAPTLLNSGTNVNVPTTNDLLQFEGGVTYLGGTYTGDGAIRHNGNVLIDAPTTIDVGLFDADGNTGTPTTFTILHDLTLNIDSIDEVEGPAKLDFNRHDGTFNVASGAALTINLPTHARWVANGGLILGNSGPQPAQINGSPVWIGNGGIPVSVIVHGTAQFNATAMFLADTFLGLPTAADRLELNAPASFDGGIYNGPGTFAFNNTVIINDNTTINIDQMDLDGQSPGDHLLRIEPNTTLTLNTNTLDPDDGIQDDPIELREGAQLNILTPTPWVLGPDAELFLNDNIPATASVTGQDLTNQGHIRGNGNFDINLSNNGTISPGESAGLITVANNFGQGLTGTFDVEIAGTTPGTEHDQLAVTGSARLAGTLQAALIDGYTPDYGERFNVLTAAAVIGTFQTHIGLLVNADLALAPLYSSVRLSLRASIPGDLDFDNAVTVTDLATFALYFGTTQPFYNTSTNTSSWQLGDFNTDGAVTVADLALLAKNFGFDASDPTSTPLGLSLGDAATFAGIDLSSVAVPEPATVLWLSLAFASTIRARPHCTTQHHRRKK